MLCASGSRTLWRVDLDGEFRPPPSSRLPTPCAPWSCSWQNGRCQDNLKSAWGWHCKTVPGEMAGTRSTFPASTPSSPANHQVGVLVVNTWGAIVIWHLFFAPTCHTYIVLGRLRHFGLRFWAGTFSLPLPQHPSRRAAPVQPLFHPLLILCLSPGSSSSWLDLISWHDNRVIFPLSEPSAALSFSPRLLHSWVPHFLKRCRLASYHTKVYLDITSEISNFVCGHKCIFKINHSRSSHHWNGLQWVAFALWERRECWRFTTSKTNIFGSASARSWTIICHRRRLLYVSRGLATAPRINGLFTQAEYIL